MKVPPTIKLLVVVKSTAFKLEVPFDDVSTLTQDHSPAEVNAATNPFSTSAVEPDIPSNNQFAPYIVPTIYVTPSLEVTASFTTILSPLSHTPARKKSIVY